MNISSTQKRESVKKIYDQVAEAYAADFGHTYPDMDILYEFATHLKPQSILLDLGGGTGNVADFFIQKGHKAVCYDFSAEMMKKAQEFFPHVPYILDDMVFMTKHFKKASFDGILACYSLFHIPHEEIDSVFSSIRDLLKADGLFCFVAKLGKGEEWLDEPYLKEKGKQVLYMNWMTKKQINALLKKNGLKKIYQVEKKDVEEKEPGKGEDHKLFIIAQKHAHFNR